MSVRTGLVGAAMMPIAFFTGIQWGLPGLAWAWLGGMAALLVVTVELSRPIIGITRRALIGAAAPGFGAAAAMAGLVVLLDAALPPMADGPRLAILVVSGAAAYGVLLFAFARRIVDEVVNLVRPARTIRV
jgi:hypothetical protein